MICLLKLIRNFRAKHCFLSYRLRVLLHGLIVKLFRLIETLQECLEQAGLLEQVSILQASKNLNSREAFEV